MTHASIVDKFGEIATALETGSIEAFRVEELAAVEAEFPKYFEALRAHPRALIGQQVPSVVGEGTEVLRDSQDAKDWQDAVRQVLSEEVRDRVQRRSEEATPTSSTLHASVELFQRNADLVPGTKEFDRELATQFTKLAKGFEVRNEGGKLQGYSVPVQPLIDQLRAQLLSSRAAAPAPTPPAPTAAPVAPQVQPGAQVQSAPATPTAPAEAPQAGIPAKAGSSSEGADDFSTLFGTIGLPNLRI